MAFSSPLFKVYFLSFLLILSACSSVSDSSSSNRYSASSDLIQNILVDDQVNIPQTEVIAISPQSDSNFYNTSTDTTFFTQHAEYTGNSNAFDKINVADAWARGATGQGVTVAVVDTGVSSYSEFQGRTTEVVDQAGLEGEIYNYDPTDSFEGYGHGNQVSTIMAGNFEAILKDPTFIDSDEYNDLVNQGSVGVAYEADLVDVPYLYYQELVQNNYFSEDYASFSLNEALSRATYVNLSLGGSDIYHPANLKESLLSYKLSYFYEIEAIKQANKPENEQSIIVVSTGNGGYTEPSIAYASIPHLDSGLKGLVIAVGGINQSFNPVYNRCGSAAAWCVVAPASSIKTTSTTVTDGEVVVSNVYSSGTSLSAPIVTGGLAIVHDYFNGTLSPREVAQRVLETADDSSCLAYVCGHGILDLKAATEPLGALSMALGQNLGEYSNLNPTQALSFTPSLLSLDGIEGSIMLVDELQSPFLVPLSSVLHVNQAVSTDSSVWQPRQQSSYLSSTNELKSSDQAGFHQTRLLGDSISMAYHSPLSQSASALETMDACLAMCFTDPYTPSNLLGHSLSSVWSFGDSTHKISSCVMDQSQQCLGLSSAIKIVGLSLGATVLESKDSDQVNWFGLAVKSSSKNDIDGKGQSQSVQTALSAEYVLSSKPITLQFKRVNYQSELQLNDPLSLLKTGAVNYTQSKFGIQGNFQANKVKNIWSVHLHAFDSEHSDNALKLHIPVSRTSDQQIIYADRDVNLSTPDDYAIQAQWMQSISNNHQQHSYGVGYYSSLNGDDSPAVYRLAMKSSW